MIQNEVTEIKKIMTKNDCCIHGLAGCYVDASKNKICKFNGKFLTLDEAVFYKYLEIAKKALSGTIGNNIIEYEFPLCEESAGGRQSDLMTLMDSYNDDTALDAYYDHIIDTYDYAGNYLILIFHDNYDVVTKTKDKKSLDESEEVYQYLLIAVCPVELDKPALYYNKSVQTMESKEQDWIVGAPMTSLLFPVFSDRTTDIHSIIVNSKNVKESHPEFVENGLGCHPVKPVSEMREEFYSIIRSNFDNEELAEKAVVSAAKDISYIVKNNFEDVHRKYELKSNDIVNMLSGDNRFNDAVKDSIADAYDKLDGNLTADILVDNSLLKKNEDTIQILELEDRVVELNQKLNAKNSVDTNAIDITVPDFISDDACVKAIDGKKFVCVPVGDIDVYVNGINIKD